jgi:hypothetical protein
MNLYPIWYFYIFFIIPVSDFRTLLQDNNEICFLVIFILDSAERCLILKLLQVLL